MDMLTLLAAGIMAVNLGPVANRSYTDTPQTRGWIENENHLSLDRIPDGRQQYGDIPFLVTNSRRAGGQDFLYLAGKHWNRMPAAAALPLHTGKAYAQLHLLHAAGWVAPGQQLGELIVSYADGTQQEIPIQAGRDVADWYNGREGDNARFAHTEGSTPNRGNYVSSFSLPAKPLAGHTHTLELAECATDAGRITQLIDEYRPALTRYLRAGGAGYFRLDIAPDGVKAVFFGGDSPTPTLTLRLR